MTRKLLLIGWDAADWKTIDRLVDQGDMPVLKGLIERGTRGNLTTLHPVLSPMLWTSIATGKRPFKHGIHGFAEPDPKGGARPISNLGRSTKAVWNILNQQGLRSNVIGWWPSHPVERINGVMVSDMFQTAPKVEQGPGQPWPLRPETVWPARLAETLAEYRMRPEEMGADVLEPFVPKLQEIDLEKDKRPIGVAKILAETASIHACADWVMDHEPWDFMAVYFDAIDHFGHGFMKYHHPRQDWIPERDFELYSGIIDMGYRFHDLMLGQTLSKIDLNQTTVVICSDHGFHPDHLRPRAIPKEPAGPAVEHREHGVFLIAGPGIKRDALVHGATLLDVTPTILTVFGVAAGEDMDGEPLTECFDQPRRWPGSRLAGHGRGGGPEPASPARDPLGGGGLSEPLRPDRWPRGKADRLRVSPGAGFEVEHARPACSRSASRKGAITTRTPQRTSEAHPPPRLELGACPIR